MNKPVLFLDFDGPMFPENFIPHGRPISEYPGVKSFHKFITYWEMSPISVRQLNALYAIYPFDTVVSSSWKHYVDLDEVVELFQVNGLNLHFHDDWRTPHKMSSYRSNEISWWLDEYSVRVEDRIVCPDHMILDDPWSGHSLEGGAYKDFGFTKPYIIDPNVGIDKEVYRGMKAQVTSWANDFRSRTFVRHAPRRDWDGIIPVQERD